MNEWRQIWGLNVRVARKRRGLSQRGLASLLGVTQASVGRWETGAAIPTDEHKLRIAEVLGEDVRLLFPLARAGRS